MSRRFGVRRPILSIAVAGVLLALPVLGLECQATCVRGVGAAPASPAPHCPAHDDARSGPHPSAPSGDSDCCVHHEVTPALKVAAIERAGSRSVAIGAGASAPAAFGWRPRGVFVEAADAAAPRETLSHSSPILRL